MINWFVKLSIKNWINGLLFSNGEFLKLSFQLGFNLSSSFTINPVWSKFPSIFQKF